MLLTWTYYVYPHTSRNYGHEVNYHLAMFGDGIEQPIPFSHRLHVTDKQIDCFYCHPYGERSMNTYLGVSAELGPEDVPEDVARGAKPLEVDARRRRLLVDQPSHQAAPAPVHPEAVLAEELLGDEVGGHHPHASCGHARAEVLEQLRAEPPPLQGRRADEAVQVGDRGLGLAVADAGHDLILPVQHHVVELAGRSFDGEADVQEEA